MPVAFRDGGFLKPAVSPAAISLDGNKNKKTGAGKCPRLGNPAGRFHEWATTAGKEDWQRERPQRPGAQRERSKRAVQRSKPHDQTAGEPLNAQAPTRNNLLS
jgi:hypothetical protein